jgi:NADPH:quinone reductase-like Zn-dependent oxidoreductase
MISADDRRLDRIARAGFTPIDRRPFAGVIHDADRYRADPDYRRTYQEAEGRFVEMVGEMTGGAGVSIFIDFIGLPVLRATLRALGRPGVLATAGWKGGMALSTVRALECMNWHLHAHTHYARYSDGVEAVRFGEENGWLPAAEPEVWEWDDIPELARAHAENRVSSYFPIFRVNPA